MTKEIDKTTIGSQTAIAGFKNEKDIADKFNNWETDTDAQYWLEIMHYNLNEIEFVNAIVISGYKADLNVKIQIKLKKALNIENIQVKLVSNKSGFNQIDKRWLSKYQELWHIPNNVYDLLAYFTGEKSPYKTDTRDNRRMFIDEFTKDEQYILLSWMDQNKILIVTDILRGRGEFSAEWVLVAQKQEKHSRWVLKNINEVINHYMDDGKVSITSRGSLSIGKITIQRKGGDNGRITSNMLQFKINPIDLFNIQ